MELVGVYEEGARGTLAQVMAKLGVKRGMVVFGQDRLDEISMSAPTAVCDLRRLVPVPRDHPEQFGYKRCSKDDLTGAHRKKNAAITRSILSGEEKGPKRQAVCPTPELPFTSQVRLRPWQTVVRPAEKLIDEGAAMKSLKNL